MAQQANARYKGIYWLLLRKGKESGRGKPKMYQEFVGKKFEAELTGNEEFYKK